jgi:hypothetical protein
MNERPSLGRPRTTMILLGGITVGILDMLFAFTYYGLILGIPMLRIFQSVAAGVLGKAATEGGGKTFALGLALHFVVATCIAAVYYLASLNLSLLLRYPIVSGLIYGVVSYFGMRLLVMPLSKIGSRPLPRMSIMIVEIIGHAVLVGLPLGLIASRSARRSGQ